MANYLDSKGLTYLWSNLKVLLNGKTTLLLYKDFGTITADLTMPTIDIGELKPYQVTRAISKTVYMDLPSGGRYIEAHYVIDNNSSTGRGSSSIDIKSGGREINSGMGNHTIRGFYLRIE